MTIVGALFKISNWRAFWNVSFVVAIIASNILSSLFGEAALSQTTKPIREYQDMLIWTGDYDGLVDGVRGTGTEQAIKKFQKRIGHAETGELTGAEIAMLRKQGQQKKLAAGFQQVDDSVSGVSVGMPLKLISGPTKKIWGQNWAAPDDSIDIDTVRYIDVTLREIFNRLMSFRGRQVKYFKFTEEWCVVSGIDRDGAAIYVRMAEQKSTEKGVLSEIRGFSLRLTGGSEVEFQTLASAMSSTFTIIPVGQKPSVAAGPPQDLLRTPPQELKTKDAVSRVKGTGICFNGLGDCPPSASSCLKGLGSSECAPLIKGE